MNARPIELALALTLVASCDGGGSGGGGSPLVNLGLSAVALHDRGDGHGDLWAVEVSELDEGGQDLNGDGDALDRVLFVHRLSDGALVNLGRALAVVSGSGVLVVGNVLLPFAVSEAAQGGVDLNGDGDALDAVLHVYDDNTGTVTNTGLALSPSGIAIGAGLVAFAVDEAAQGDTDLDGNGSTAEAVLHVFDSRTGVTTNAGRNVTAGLGIVFQDHAFAFGTNELPDGVDRNGDGDTFDSGVFQLYDLFLGGVMEMPVVLRSPALGAGARGWAVLADEFQQGADLNGDGDMLDGVYELVDPHGPTVQPLAFSSTTTFPSTTDGTDLALVAQEIDGVDRNMDGDLADSIAVFYDAAHDQPHDTGLAIDTDDPLVFTDTCLAFLADEHDQGLDLNGDGDTNDRILHVVDRTTGAVTNLGEDVFRLYPAAGRVGFTRSELSSGVDYNGDGDTTDLVVFTWLPPSARPPAGEIANTGLAGNGQVLASNASTLLLLGIESAQGADLNGDGDLDDVVLVLHDLATGRNQGLDAGTLLPDAGLTDEGRGVVLVSEDLAGRDLNGDGDTNDHVLHALEVR